LDRPEKLDYPTEAWAAHDLRKANVLRLAAAFVDEPRRLKWARRGDELAERGWSDLLRFDSRYSARAAAIVLQEGLRDLLLRCSCVGAQPAAEIGMDHGLPEEFVAQKRRVLGRLKSPRGMIVAVRSLTSIGNWRAILAARRRARSRAALVRSDRP